ncbi:HD domain-containing phosphohydrolase [Geomesophilobacter sediminis]|uniref:Response regulator n=1 Tax=Geomesophilobacter sediminis TaxID=2798584 RepID=A0A8J7LVG3_9BACT|nr:HD domain-containing phosphohydrolase [Geomesophilobacter sediminis]MBJ6724990.1 response regulator [Geomesophilobacter sediminis]
MNGSIKLMAVDDVQMDLELMRVMLAGSVDIFLTALNGQEAYDLLLEHPDTDAILLDLEMPVMNGFQFLELVKGDERFANIPIIVITLDPKEVLRSLSLGANDFLAKPYNPEELKLRVQNHLRTKKLYDLTRGMSAALEEEVVKKTAQLRKALAASRRTEFEISLRLGKAAEYRDFETGMHIRRISDFANLLGRLAGLSEKACETLRYASPLHDVGKIGVPDRILLKPGPLEPAEFEIMKLHTVIGGKILSAEDGTYPVIAAGRIIAMQHHEKWDGTGYPLGLKGEQIHIFGRIVMTVDIFDALRSERPYKTEFSLEKTLSMMKDRDGTFIDPRLLAIFLEHVDEFEQLRNELRDREPAPAILHYRAVV